MSEPVVQKVGGVNYVSRTQPAGNPTPPNVPYTSGNDVEFLEGTAFTVSEGSSEANGTNPSMPTTLPAFGNGPDVIRRK